MSILTWILILVAVGVVISILVWIADHIEAILWAVAGIVGAGVIFWLIKYHEDVFMLLAKFFLGGLIIIAIGYFISQAANSVLSSSKNYMKVKSDGHLHQTEEKLLQKLNETASKKDIGHITMGQMQNMFSNYANKSYPENRNFYDIASKFVNDCERQNFINNKTWAEPYVQYIVKMEARSLQQLLQEVNGPLKHFMHFTPDEKLLSQKLNEYCKSKEVGTPAILTQITVNGVTLYRPTEYGTRLYNKTLVGQEESEEVNFDDL